MWIDDDSNAWLATISILYEIHRVEWYIVSMGWKIFKFEIHFIAMNFSLWKKNELYQIILINDV